LARKAGHLVEIGCAFDDGTVFRQFKADESLVIFEDFRVFARLLIDDGARDIAHAGLVEAAIDETVEKKLLRDFACFLADLHGSFVLWI
jgi:hypothetical protein